MQSRCDGATRGSQTGPGVKHMPGLGLRLRLRWKLAVGSFGQEGIWHVPLRPRVRAWLLQTTERES